MEHTVRSFDEELNGLRDSTVRLGARVVALIDSAFQALTPQDPALALAQQEPVIGDLYAHVDTQVLRILALRSPMAEDLRFVVACLKVSASLLQAAHHAAHIVERAATLGAAQNVRSLRSIRFLGEDVRDMLVTVMTAFAERDVERAMAVWHHDQVVDEQHSGLFRELLTYMMEDPHNITVCSDLVFMAKDIERIGDQATNIAEMVYFLVNGLPVNSLRPKGDTAASIAG